MNLLTFIDLQIEKVSSGKSGSSREKDIACRGALKFFLGDKECDLRKAILSDFLYDFGTFLARKYEKRYSPSTNREILRTLRKWIRQAISLGYVPNIDVMPSVIERLDREFWDDAEADGKKKAPVSLRQELKVRESVNRVTRYVDSWAIRQRMGKDARPAGKEERERALGAQSAAIYLFGLFTYGLEIKESLAIRCDWESREVPDTVFIEKYGMQLPLSQPAKNLVRFYNRGALCTEHLFFTLDSKRYKENPDNAARIIDGHFSKYLQRESLPLYQRKSLFIDWLNYAIESGLGDRDAETLWKYRLGEESAAAALTALEAAQATFTASKSDLDETWYLLSIIPLSIKRERFMKMFLATGILGSEEEARLSIYAPEETLRNKERGEHAVFSRYIFFRATQLQAEFANSFSPYAYVLKERSSMKFAQIRRQEIEHLREMLRDFPDVVEMQDGKRWLEEHNAEIMVGCKAVIRSGSLAGKEATVVRIKGKKEDELTFILEFVEGTMKFRTSLQGVQLDIVQAP